jgi:adenylate cyclase
VISRKPPAGADEAFWREFLTNGHSRERRMRGLLRRIPHEPRCKLCAAPFGGIGAPVMRLIGKRPSHQNPRMCAACFTFLSENHGGAEIECSLLFADIRSSTSMAERMTPAEFRGVLDRFYDVAAQAVFDSDGAIDKFVGDEVVAMFYPMLTGERHASRAVEAAQVLLVRTGHGEPGGPWVPVGAGVHTGRAWVGAVGEGTHTELTVLGDTVNTAARLAGVAAAGEVVVTTDAARAAGLDPALETRALDLKGKELPTEVVTLRVSAPATAVDRIR